MDITSQMNRVNSTGRLLTALLIVALFPMTSLAQERPTLHFARLFELQTLDESCGGGPIPYVPPAPVTSLVCGDFAHMVPDGNGGWIEVMGSDYAIDYYEVDAFISYCGGCSHIPITPGNRWFVLHQLLNMCTCPPDQYWPDQP